MNPERRKCLFVVPSLKRGGAETQLIDLVNGLAPERFEKHLLVLEDNLDQLQRLQQATVRLHHLPKRSSFDTQLIREVARLIECENFDIVHATLQYSLFIAYLAIRRTRLRPRLVVAIHTTVNVGIKEELFDRGLYRPLINRCDAVVFVCHNQKKHWLAKFPELAARSHVIYNGVDVDRFVRSAYMTSGKRLRRQYAIPETDTLITCIAGFRPEKGHSLLLRAFAGIGRDDLWLLLAGDGPLRKPMEALAAELQISERVVFLGNLADVGPLLAVASVMVLPSTAVETFSIAMLEAMSMGVPVIASDIGGLNEAIEDRLNGLLTVSGSQSSLEQAFAEFVNSPQSSAFGQRCREKVLQRFTLNHMIDDTTELLSFLGT